MKEFLPYIIMLVIVLLIRIVLLINATIPTESMENTIPRKTRVMGLKSSYWFQEPARGDIVVFDAPDEPGTPGKPGNPSNPKTGDMGIYGSIAALIAAALVAFFLMRKKKED